MMLRDAITWSLEVLVKAQEGCNGATAQDIKQAYDKIKAGEFTEKEWVALEWQSRPIMAKADQIMKLVKKFSENEQSKDNQ